MSPEDLNPASGGAGETDDSTPDAGHAQTFDPTETSATDGVNDAARAEDLASADLAATWRIDPVEEGTTAAFPSDAASVRTQPQGDLPLTPPAPSVTVAPVAASAELPPPRTRWAGILWGLVFLVLSVLGLFAVLDDGVREAAAQWWLTLTPVSLVAYAALAIGAIIIVCAAIGLIGRAQRNAAQRACL